jgi:hypothetical protein
MPAGSVAKAAVGAESRPKEPAAAAAVTAAELERKSRRERGVKI